jgi:hypothetical protein
MGKDKQAYVELSLKAKEKGDLGVKNELQQNDPTNEEAAEKIKRATSSVVEGVD